MISSSTRFTRFILFLLTLFILSGSCSKKKSIRGKDYIPREQLIDVLIDVHLVDGLTNDMRYYRKYFPDDSINIYNPIFKKHKVSKEKFERTLDEYSKYPYLLDEVYDQVLMELTQMQDELENEKNDKNKVNKSKPDSPIKR